MPRGKIAKPLMDYISPEPNSGCWLWTGARSKLGYGHVRSNGSYHPAHRVVYEHHRGPIPEGMELDHKCRLTCCVNPDHLEPVTHKENMRRAQVLGFGAPAKQKAKTNCPYGHRLVSATENGRHRRKCQVCNNAAGRRYRARKKEQNAGRQ